MIIIVAGNRIFSFAALNRMRKKNYRLIIAMALLAVAYVICFIGITGVIPSPLLNLAIPFTLLFSVMVLLIFHQPRTAKSIFILLLLMVTGYCIGYAGAHTGLIFGEYAYGSALGRKIMNTPIVIGLHWFILVYVTHVSVRLIGIARPWIELTAAALMTAIDYLAEPVAMQYDLWQWKDGIIPVQNFVAWFYISFLLQLFINRVKPAQENQVAIPILVLQILFYAALNML